jgi:hypothetical protein
MKQKAKKQSNYYTGRLTPDVFNGQGKAEHLEQIYQCHCDNPWFRALSPRELNDILKSKGACGKRLLLTPVS